MDRAKRASMREGPLAQLFRRTDEDAPQDQATPAEEPQAERQSAEQRLDGPIANPEASVETREAARPLTPDQERAARREADRRSPVEGLEELRPAPPSQRHHHEPEVRREAPSPTTPHREPGVRGPKQRLEEVFSTDVPDNMLDRSPRRDDEYRGRYGREVPEPSATHPEPVLQPVLRVVGVGGAGVNAVNRMIEAGVEGVDFIAVNTDVQSLQQSSAPVTQHIGSDVTRGLGSGSDPEIGRQAALDSYDQLKAMLKGSDMVFIAAGSGGGTGTGAAPVVARITRELGALAVGIVTKPFTFEGSRRADQADRGIQALAEEVDTLITIPNTRLLSVLDKRVSMVDAFRMADDVLRQGVQGISDLITLPGLINLDFADVRTIMADAGPALLGIGMGVGEQRAMEAATHAVASPLLETSVEGARSILLSITGGRDLSLWEVNEAAKAVAEAAHPDANIIFGAMVDENVVDQVWVTVVATGYGDRPLERAHSARDTARAAREADGEPRVSRAPANGGSALSDIEIPEFLPRS
ncbi:MAG: cell division protein FtsZ [Thermoleophilaceae bacterium]|jgi:cell division protein FtsZ|nr:cell division protein FtsZ [Thermoleophilaceae bacterium]